MSQVIAALYALLLALATHFGVGLPTTERVQPDAADVEVVGYPAAAYWSQDGKDFIVEAEVKCKDSRTPRAYLYKDDRYAGEWALGRIQTDSGYTFTFAHVDVVFDEVHLRC